MSEKIVGEQSIYRTIGLFYLAGYAIGKGTTAIQKQKTYGPRYSLYFGGVFAVVGAGIFIAKKSCKRFSWENN